MLVILKIPVVYLCAVVWWAIRAEPRPLEGAGKGLRSDADAPGLRLAHPPVPRSGVAHCRAGSVLAAGARPASRTPRDGLSS